MSDLLGEVVTPAGELTLSPSPNDDLGPVTDTRDLRVMIPRMRRAIDGPRATSSASVAATLSDSEVLGLIADSTANVILLTGGSLVFGYELEPTHYDPFYKAPDQWQTNKELTPLAQDVIIAQGAIDFYAHKLRSEPFTSEKIADEAQQWEWTKSAQMMSVQLKMLAEVRDRALEMLERINAPVEAYISSVAERDKLAAVYLEPWVSEIGAPVPWSGLSAAYIGGFDFRFGTFG
jgi:hypothetical protein